MKKLINFYFNHKKLCIALLGVLVVAAVFKFPHTAHAAGDFDEDTTKLLKEINQIFNMLLRLSAAWLWPIILMIGSLLDNDLIFGGAMGDRLLGVWVQIRNLVNIVFVLILLAIAVYNVLPISEEGGGLPLGFKTVLPKFILALVAVNFSFLAIKVVLDFTNVLTGAVFALPTTAIDNPQYNLSANVESIICGTPSKEVPFKPLWCDGDKLNERAQNLFSKLDRSNITLAYAIRFGKAPQLKFIKDGLADLSQLGFNIIFNTVLYVIFAVSFIVLFLVLLFRLVVLWVAVVLSPVIALTIVLPNLKELGGGSELQDQFVKNAIAPIKIGLVLSIGYIMLDGFEADKTIHGDILSSSTLTAVDPNSLPTDITDLQQLMIAVATVVIIWVGVFKAADDTAAKMITGPIRDHMQNFGKFMAKLPMYAQVIPAGGKIPGKKPGEGVSLAEIGQTATRFMQGPVIQPLFDPWGGKDRAPPELASKWQRAAQDAKSDRGRASAAQLAENPYMLATPEGFSSFREAMINSGTVKAEDFEARYGRDYHDAKKAADGLYKDKNTNREFINALQTMKGINNAEALKKAIDEKPEEKQDPVKALNPSGNPDEIAKTPAFNGVFSKIEIAQIIKWPDEIKQALFEELGPDGKVKDITNVNAVTKLIGDLRKVRDVKQAETITRQGLADIGGKDSDTEMVKKIVNSLPFENDSGDAFKNAARGAIENSGKGSPPAPPSTRTAVP